MRNYLLLPVFCIIAFVISGCYPEGKNEPEPEPSNLPAEKKTNISYGPDQRNKMNATLPANRNSSTPVAILIHGGGWTAGDMNDMQPLQDSLAARGIASVSINYRYVSPSVHYEDLMADVRLAVDKVTASANEWHVRKDRFVMGGLSAGAHMSLLYSYKYNYNGKVTGVVSAAGPTDFTDQSWLNYAVLINVITSINYLVGVDYNPFVTLDAKFSAVSPIKNPANIPTLMIHGDADAVVYYSQPANLHAALDAKGYTNKLITIPGANHDLGVANPATAAMIVSEIALWVDTYGK